MPRTLAIVCECCRSKRVTCDTAICQFTPKGSARECLDKASPPREREPRPEIQHCRQAQQIAAPGIEIEVPGNRQRREFDGDTDQQCPDRVERAKIAGVNAQIDTALLPPSQFQIGIGFGGPEPAYVGVEMHRGSKTSPAGCIKVHIGRIDPD